MLDGTGSMTTDGMVVAAVVSVERGERVGLWFSHSNLKTRGVWVGGFCLAPNGISRGPKTV